jgi:hypothetical protein
MKLARPGRGVLSSGMRPILLLKARSSHYTVYYTESAKAELPFYSLPNDLCVKRQY